MAEYIDRKKLMDDISKYSIENYSGLIRSVVLKQPAADVVEAVHGEWKKAKGMMPPEYHGRHICTECRRMALSWQYHELLSNYCPYCGAKMDGGKK